MQGVALALHILDDLAKGSHFGLSFARIRRIRGEQIQVTIDGVRLCRVTPTRSATTCSRRQLLPLTSSPQIALKATDKRWMPTGTVSWLPCAQHAGLTLVGLHVPRKKHLESLAHMRVARCGPDHFARMAADQALAMCNRLARPDVELAGGDTQELLWGRPATGLVSAQATVPECRRLRLRRAMPVVHHGSSQR